MLNPYFIFLLALILQLSLLSQATDLLAGHIGRVGLSAPIFAGIAGYTYALTTTHLHVHPWLAVAVSLSITLLISAIIGFMLSRLNAEEFLMGTFAIQVGFVDLVKNLEITGGPLGIRDVPTPCLSSMGSDATIGSLFILIPALAFAVPSLMLALGPHSALGRAYHWIRDDYKSAIAYGIHAENLLQKAFIVHAIVAGTAGIGFVIAQTYVGPSSFELWLSLQVLTIVFLSGTGGNTLLMLIGATVMVSLIEVVNAVVADPQMVGAFQQIVFNGLLIGILIFRKRGIGGPILETGPSADRVA